jgi:hypothetical protein
MVRPGEGGNLLTGPGHRTLIRRRTGLERLTSNNEIAGFKFTTASVIYAVLLGPAYKVA